MFLEREILTRKWIFELRQWEVTSNVSCTWNEIGQGKIHPNSGQLSSFRKISAVWLFLCPRKTCRLDMCLWHSYPQYNFHKQHVHKSTRKNFDALSRCSILDTLIRMRNESFWNFIDVIASLELGYESIEGIETESHTRSGKDEWKPC